MVIAIIVILLLALYAFLIWPAKADTAAKSGLTERSYAHRGYHSQDKTVPENSMAAFKQAVERGYGIELDVRLTADGRVVVFHDDTLKRMCGADRQVISLTLKELQAYRLLDTQERIPLFSEVLGLVAGRTPLIVELKQVDEYALLSRLTWALLKEYKGAFCIESFDPRIVAWFRKNAPQVLRGQLSANHMKSKNLPWFQRFMLTNLLTNYMGRPHFIAYSEGSMGNINFRLCTRMLGALPVAWTVRSIETFERLQREGCTMQIFEFIDPPAKVPAVGQVKA